MTTTSKIRSLVLLSLVLGLAGLVGCSGSKNVTKEEQQAIKDWLLQGLPEEIVKQNKFESFEGMDDPDAKEGKVKYVRVIYKAAGGHPGDMLIKFKDGKIVKHIPNGAGANWKEGVAKLNW